MILEMQSDTDPIRTNNDVTMGFCVSTTGEVGRGSFGDMSEMDSYGKKRLSTEITRFNTKRHVLVRWYCV